MGIDKDTAQILQVGVAVASAIRKHKVTASSIADILSPLVSSVAETDPARSLVQQTIKSIGASIDSGNLDVNKFCEALAAYLQQLAGNTAQAADREGSGR